MKACCSEYQRGKDVRIFHAQNTLMSKFVSLNETLANLWEKSLSSCRTMSASSVLVSRLFNLLIYLSVGLKALCGAFGVGNLLKYTGAVFQFGDGVSLLVQTVREIVQNIPYMEDYFSYQDMPNRTADATLPVTEEIRENYTFEFRHVTFTYPGASSPSLSDLSCRFQKGKRSPS